MILIQRLNKIIFLTPLADIFKYLKQKLTKLDILCVAVVQTI